MRLMWLEVAILWRVLVDALGFNLSEMCTDLSALQTNRRLKIKPAILHDFSTTCIQSCGVYD